MLSPWCGCCCAALTHKRGFSGCGQRWRCRAGNEHNSESSGSRTLHQAAGVLSAAGDKKVGWGAHMCMKTQLAIYHAPASLARHDRLDESLWRNAASAGADCSYLAVAPVARTWAGRITHSLGSAHHKRLCPSRPAAHGRRGGRAGRPLLEGRGLHRR